MCLISIIVPVYNMEQHLEECLKSILTQTYRNYEIILVDDGSTDSSGLICDKYAKKFSKIKVIHKENGGVSSARNCGIDFANGKYIMFVDSDDRIHPQICQCFGKIAIEEKADIVMGKAIEGSEFSEDMFADKENFSYKVLAEKKDRLKMIYFEDKHKYWTVWCKLYNKKLFEQTRFEEGKMYEDNGVVFKLLYDAKIVIDVDEEFYFYLINKSGITKSSFSKSFFDVLWAYELQIDFYKEHDDNYMMRTIVCRYLQTCADYYYKSKNILNNDKYAQDLKEKMKIGMDKWEKECDLDISEIPNVYKILFPIKYYQYAVKKRLLENIQ